MEIKDTIKSFIMTELLAEKGLGSLADADPLIDSGIIDSFGIMALMSFLEEKFSIQIAGDELIPENFESVMRISALVAQKTECSLGV
ncbi:MAG: acyl carrier protein [Desulfuromonadales bacterium]|nr:acyl carrier protein [Desulfuromonadales bacterium]